tara:strand:+ start:891 stop:1205 length:315 start_codon:yes stop_codon:yes gene_type:complete
MEVKNNRLIIFRLLNPLTLNTSSSLSLIKFKKNNKDEIKKINGKISNKTEGAFKKVKIKGTIKLTSELSKKEISSKIFKITINRRKTIETIASFKRNFLIKYFL